MSPNLSRETAGNSSASKNMAILQEPDTQPPETETACGLDGLDVAWTGKFYAPCDSGGNYDSFAAYTLNYGEDTSPNWIDTIKEFYVLYRLDRGRLMCINRFPSIRVDRIYRHSTGWRWRNAAFTGKPAKAPDRYLSG